MILIVTCTARLAAYTELVGAPYAMKYMATSFSMH